MEKPRAIGVSVLFIDDGRDPVMVVTEQSTGRQRERIPLKDYDSEEALKELMAKFGFQKRTQREYQSYKAKQRKFQADWDVENERRVEEQALKMTRKKDEIAERVMKMMQANLKKQQAAQEMKV